MPRKSDPENPLLSVKIGIKMKQELQKEADTMYRGNLSSLVLKILEIYLGDDFNGRD